MYRSAVLQFLVAAAFIGGGLYAWQHFRQAPATPVAEEGKPGAATQTSEIQSGETKMAREVVTIHGPLADYMNHKPSEME